MRTRKKIAVARLVDDYLRARGRVAKAKKTVLQRIERDTEFERAARKLRLKPEDGPLPREITVGLASLKPLRVKRDPLDVIRSCGAQGCPPGALGKSCSLRAKPTAFPQAFAAYGWRLAKPLMAAGYVERTFSNGQTRFVAITTTKE